MEYVKNFFSLLATIVLAILGVSYFRNKEKLAEYERENKENKLNEEMNEKIKEFQEADLNDIISQHNQDIRRRKQDS